MAVIGLSNSYPEAENGNDKGLNMHLTASVDRQVWRWDEESQ